MCGDETDADEAEWLPEAAFEFESYFDRDSGLWSLRRVPSTSPPKSDGDGEDHEDGVSPERSRPSGQSSGPQAPC